MFLKKSKKKSQIVEIDKFCACLPGHEEVTISKKTYFNITPRFYHKSGSELRLEQSQRTKLITA